MIQEVDYCVSGTAGDIQGTLRSQSSNILCLFVHGLTGNLRRRLMREGAKKLSAVGCDTLRINLYNGETRSMRNVSFEQHLTDINLVLKEMSKKYDYIHLIGHSVGGMLSFVVDDTYVTSIVGWDPTIVGRYSKIQNVPYDDKLGCYIFGIHLISADLMEQMKDVPDDYMKDVQLPYLVACSEKVGYYDGWKAYQNQSLNHKIVMIEGSSHSFEEWGCEEQLFDITKEWIKGFIG